MTNRRAMATEPGMTMRAFAHQAVNQHAPTIDAPRKARSMSRRSTGNSASRFMYCCMTTRTVLRASERGESDFTDASALSDIGWKPIRFNPFDNLFEGRFGPVSQEDMPRRGVP